MAEGTERRLEGLDDVLRGFDKADRDVRKAAMKGLEEAAMDIIADAKTNLRRNRSVVTGLLRASGKVQKVNEETLDAGFFDTLNRQSGYATYVEYGRRAGRMPPPDEMAQWAYKKFGLHDRTVARSLGWAIATNIARKGTKPHPFFAPAVEKNKRKILDTLAAAIDRVTR